MKHGYTQLNNLTTETVCILDIVISCLNDDDDDDDDDVFECGDGI
jgi:hypothetical protein